MTGNTNATDKTSKLSPAKLALLEKRLRGQRGDDQARRIPRRQTNDFIPVSYAQQRLWFLDQLEPGSAAYNISAAFRLEGLLDSTALGRTLRTIVQRHEVLRTSFDEVAGEPVQVISAVGMYDLTAADLSCLLPETQLSEVTRVANELGRCSFDLSRLPLFRLCLLRLNKTQHLLLLVIHHIIADTWSISLFFRELSSGYAAISTGSESHLSRLPIQYGDYAIWQRSWLEAGALEKQLAYWREQLTAAPGLLSLPTDKPRPQKMGFQGRHLCATFPRSIADGLRTIAQQENATLFIVLLAAFNVLLARYSDQDDILVGSPIAGRNQLETESLIGCFVNTLVLRSNLSGDPLFIELLRKTREMTLAAYANQDVPFEKLVQELRPPRGVGHSPFFQVILEVHHASDTSSHDSEWKEDIIEVERGAARADLLLSIAEKDSLFLWVEYSTELFERPTIERLLNHFEVLLRGIVANPERRISELPLLTETERRQLLGKANENQSKEERDVALPQLFEVQVARTPYAVALVFEDQRLTYAELNGRANQLARYLRKRGVGPEVLVGICLERSLEMVVAILGVLKVGAAYVPLDPASPQERLAFMIEDSDVVIVLSHSGLKDKPGLAGCELVYLDDAEALLTDAEGKELGSGVGGNNAAYVIYTSGSTGKPKGVVVTHRNVVRLFEVTDSLFQFNDRDVWTLFHSYAFDFSVWELWGALLYGGRIVIVPYLMSRSPKDFYKLLSREKVTVLNQTPSAFRQLMQADKELAGDGDLLLRLVIFGGEALEVQSLRPWFERHSDQKPQLVNMYGITETTVHVTYRPLTMADTNQATGSVIGLPLGDLQLYVLDRHQELAATGVAGEMYVGGPGLARGYLNGPELTAERFVPHRFSQQPGQSLYRSGDLARYLANGDLEYLGRIDRQIKIRGFRVELGEIEAVLGQYPGVVECVVIDRETRQHEQQLAAYLVVAGAAQPKVEELQAFLKRQLPDYMVPSSFAIIERLPLTVNGKIDRRALPDPESSSLRTQEFVLPKSGTQEKLAGIWSIILGRAVIGLHDNFFDLGGHSLLATQVVSRIRDEFGIELPLRSFFEMPTVETLSAKIDQLRSAGLPSRNSSIKRISRESRRATVSETGSLILPEA